MLGTYDAAGFAPNLSGKGGLVVKQMSTITSNHTPLGTLTDQQVADLKAWLNSN